MSRPVGLVSTVCKVGVNMSVYIKVISVKCQSFESSLYHNSYTTLKSLSSDIILQYSPGHLT